MNEEQRESANTLPPGLSLEQVQEALLQSGYPLQTAVAELLKTEFHVLPEWGYRDRVSGMLRTLFILALRPLAEVASAESRVRPNVALLIECKRSDLPFVFFSERELSHLHSSEVPRVCGLPKEVITISTDDDRSRWLFRPLHALELDRSPFVENVDACSVFSKCVRKSGGKLELSGTEAYSNIMMSLMSAVQHFVNASTPTRQAFWFDAFMVVPVAIIDAPMIAYDANASEDGLKYTSWQRVFRNEPGEKTTFWGHLGSLSAVDIVHRDYFDSYLTDHLMPFANEFSKLTIRHNHELASGKAFASGFGEDSWTNIERRIKPTEILKGPPARIPPKESAKAKRNKAKKR